MCRYASMATFWSKATSIAMISSKAILEVFLTDGSSAAQLWSVTLRIYIHRWLCTRARCLCPRRWPCSPSSVRSSTAVAAYSFLAALYWLTTVACVVVGSPVSVVAGAFSSFNARLATKSFSSQLQLWAADWQQTKTTAEYSSIACLPPASSSTIVCPSSMPANDMDPLHCTLPVVHLDCHAEVFRLMNSA